MQQQQIDNTIKQIEHLYQSITGKPAPEHTDKPYAVIPPERDPAEHVNEQLDRLLQTMQSAIEQQHAGAWNPPMSLWETQEEICVAVDLPGVSQDNVNVSLEQNMLNISGKRMPPKSNSNARGLAARHQEAPLGMFHRQIPLPMAMEPDALHAQLKNGVLEIRFKRPAPEGKKIQVR